MFAKTVLDKCQVIEIRSWQIEQAITMFNSLNSTGMPLSDADIISAQLYSNAGEQTLDFNQKWKNINELVDTLNSRKITNIDSVLQQFMYITRALEKTYIKPGRNSASDKRSVDVTTPGLRRYYMEINKELLSDPLSLCAKLEKIALIWEKITNFSIVKLLLKYNANIRLYLISYLYRYEPDQLNENIVTEITECLLRLFTVLELVDAGYSSVNFKSFLFDKNIDLVDKNIRLEEIANDFDRHISLHWEQSEIRERIQSTDKHLFVFLNEYLYAKENGKTFKLNESVNIEHIMPASGKNISSIRSDAGINDREEFRALVNQVGNKILLEEKINKSIGNSWFQTKKQTSIKKKSGYKDSMYPLALSLVNYPKDTWTQEDIEKATAKATDRITKFIFSLT